MNDRQYEAAVATILGRGSALEDRVASQAKLIAEQDVCIRIQQESIDLLRRLVTGRDADVQQLKETLDTRPAVCVRRELRTGQPGHTDRALTTRKGASE